MSIFPSGLKQKRCKRCRKPFLTKDSDRVLCDDCIKTMSANYGFSYTFNPQAPVEERKRNPRKLNPTLKVSEKNYYCEVCGKQLERVCKRGRHPFKYCSEECRVEARKKGLSKDVRKTCPDCGKEFVVSQSHDIHFRQKHPGLVELCKICGRKDDFKHHLDNLLISPHSPLTKPRTCDECGKSFQPVSGPDKYCSRECKLAVQRRKSDEIRKKRRSIVIEKKCPACNRIFKTNAQAVKQFGEYLKRTGKSEEQKCKECTEKIMKRRTSIRNMKRTRLIKELRAGEERWREKMAKGEPISDAIKAYFERRDEAERNAWRNSGGKIITHRKPTREGIAVLESDNPDDELVTYKGTVMTRKERNDLMKS